jgi:hypothetical protein
MVRVGAQHFIFSVVAFLFHVTRLAQNGEVFHQILDIFHEIVDICHSDRVVVRTLADQRELSVFFFPIRNWLQGLLMIPTYLRAWDSFVRQSRAFFQWFVCAYLHLGECVLRYFCCVLRYFSAQASTYCGTTPPGNGGHCIRGCS